MDLILLRTFESAAHILVQLWGRTGVAVLVELGAREVGPCPACAGVRVVERDARGALRCSECAWTSELRPTVAELSQDASAGG